MYMGFVNSERVKTKKVWKVYTKDEYGFYDKSYCYSKADALRQRSYMQSLGITKVMIKGRR